MLGKHFCFREHLTRAGQLCRTARGKLGYTQSALLDPHTACSRGWLQAVHTLLLQVADNKSKERKNRAMIDYQELRTCFHKSEAFNLPVPLDSMHSTKSTILCICALLWIRKDFEDEFEWEMIGLRLANTIRLARWEHAKLA